MRATLAACLLAAPLLAAPLLATEAPRPFVAPLVAVSPDAPLPAGRPVAGPLSLNAPGVLVDVPAARYGDESLATRLAALVEEAHRTGRRAGVALEVPEQPVPESPTAAEAATAAGLVPGIDRVIRAACEADLFVLSLRDLRADVRSRSYLFRKVAAYVRAQAPAARIAVLFHEKANGLLFPKEAADLLSEEAAAYVDILGLELDDTAADPVAIRKAADAVAFARPLLVRTPELADASALLSRALTLAPLGAPHTAAPLASAADTPLLDRLGALLSGDFARDARLAEAVSLSGAPLLTLRAVTGTELGGTVVVAAATRALEPHRGSATLSVDAPSYAAAEVVELATGRSRRFDIPKAVAAPRLTVSTANGPVAVRLTAREKAPEEATKATTGVTAVRALTVEEILAKHQVWRARRDSRWLRFTAVNRSSIRYRFAEMNNTFELSLSGAFFFERGKGYDWAWSEAFFNGVRWKGKKIPELPLVQPEKVAELPLALTFNDSYTYTLTGPDEIRGAPVYALDFEPKGSVALGPLYAGRVYLARSDFSLVRVTARQLALVGAVQAVDETTDFGPVPAPDGGEPLQLPLKTKGQWILRTFSRTTVLERQTELTEVRVDPADYEERRKAAYASRDVMVRDTDRGVRYLERTKDGDRVLVEDAKTSRLFGLGGVFYDSSFDYPLPLLGLYYVDLDFRKKKEQIQAFFAGVLLAASYNDPSLFGTKLDLGVDFFGIAIRGTDSVYVGGVEDEAQRVKQRSFAGNFNVGYPLHRHLRLYGTLGLSHRDFAGDEGKTSSDFAIPADHWLTRLEARAAWDVSGWAITGRFGWNRRSRWDAWGYPGNADWDEGKDEYRTYGVGIAKSFHLPRFQRIRSSVSYLGTSNADRFAKLSFGSFGGTSLRGFSSSSLRAEEAFVGRLAYGCVIRDVFRLEAIYDHAIVKDGLSGLDWASFGGAGLAGQISGPWSTIVQLDVGLPVVGRHRGQTGFVVNLVFLKVF